jgi:hypothetical protein
LSLLVFQVAKTYEIAGGQKHSNFSEEHTASTYRDENFFYFFLLFEIN